MEENEKLLIHIQQYVAITPVGASTVHGYPKGTVKESREFLKKLPLGQFGVRGELEFRQCLDKATKQLKKVLPHGARKWALSRKILNIFLHNAFYNYYLRKRYSLHLAEGLFEVPVDSLVARGVCKEAPKEKFGRWPGLKRLTEAEHRKYQHHAKLLADKRGLARVHLDAVLGVQEKEREPQPALQGRRS